MRKLAKIYFRSARAVLDKLVFPLFCRRECIGVENFTSEPPYIMAINHLALFDAPLVATMCPHIVRGFVAAKHRRNVVYAAILEAAGAIWVRRGEIDRQALRKSRKICRLPA